MKAGVVVLIALATLISNGCMSTDWPSDKRTLNGRAKDMWQHNMTVVDRSVEFWKKRQPGTAPYGAEELTSAIAFFETLTKIRGANLSFIGPIPDEQLEKVSAEWKTWYATHSDRLKYDLSTRRVTVRE